MTQRPDGNDKDKANDGAYRDGYYQGVKEASETWTVIVYDCIGHYQSESDDIIDRATSELGKQGIDRTAKS